MDNEITITFNRLVEILDDFRDWYEFEWLGENVTDDKGMSAPNYWVWLMRQDASWPDRTPNSQ